MMRELRSVGIGVTPEVAARVAPAAGLDTLEDVLHHGFAQRPAWELLDVIAQDEYTNDIVMRGPPSVFVVFDTT